MSQHTKQAAVPNEVKMVGIDAVVIRADGRREDLGTVSFWHRDWIERLRWSLRDAPLGPVLVGVVRCLLWTLSALFRTMLWVVAFPLCFVWVAHALVWKKISEIRPFDPEIDGIVGNHAEGGRPVKGCGCGACQTSRRSLSHLSHRQMQRIHRALDSKIPVVVIDLFGNRLPATAVRSFNDSNKRETACIESTGEWREFFGVDGLGR